MGLTVRPAGPEDCETLALIYQQSLDARDSSMEIETSGEHFRTILNNQGARECLLLGEENRRVVGWGIVKKYSDRVGYRVACETSIYLRRDGTGRGYGTALQTALMDKVREFQYHHIVVRIWARNHGSIRFHERFGFQMVGVQKEVGYLDGEWKDVAVMQCVLSDVGPYRPEL